jgi:hypothetical protein
MSCFIDMLITICYVLSYFMLNIDIDAQDLVCFCIGFGVELRQNMISQNRLDEIWDTTCDVIYGLQFYFLLENEKRTNES